MPPTVIATQLSTGNILQAQRVVNMDAVIHDLDNQEATLTSLLMKLRKESTFNPKFDFLEDEPVPKDDAIDNGAGYAAGIVANIAVDNIGYFRQWDMILVVRTGEMILVTAVGSDLTTVVRGFGETAAAAIVDNDPLKIVGNAIMEGATSPAMRTTKVANKFNYTQIFREPVSVTRTENDSKTYGSMDIARLRRKHAVEHKKAIERAFWFGERKEDTSTWQNPRRATRGVLAWLLESASGAQNTDLAAAALTEALLDAWAEILFTYGSKTKFVFVPRAAMTKISTFAKSSNKLRMFPSDQIYGIAIFTWLTPHGSMKLIVNDLLTGSETDKRFGGWMIGLDLADLAYVFFNNADTKLLIGRQANDEDGMKDEYLTECGLKLIHPRNHGILSDWI